MKLNTNKVCSKVSIDARMVGWDKKDNVTGEASLGEKNVRVRIKVSSRMKIIRDSTLDVWPLPLIATSSSHCTRP